MIGAIPFATRRRAGWCAAACLALLIGPTLAQPASAEASSAVQSALARWVDTFNRGESTGAFFASDAVMVRGNGVFSGAALIDEMERRESKAGLRLTLVVDRVQSLGPDAAVATGGYTVTPPGAAAAIPGVSMHTLQRNGGQWLVRGASFTRTQAPPPAAAASSPAS